MKKLILFIGVAFFALIVLAVPVELAAQTQAEIKAMQDNAGTTDNKKEEKKTKAEKEVDKAAEKTKKEAEKEVDKAAEKAKKEAEKQKKNTDKEVKGKKEENQKAEKNKENKSKAEEQGQDNKSKEKKEKDSTKKTNDTKKEIDSANNKESKTKTERPSTSKKTRSNSNSFYKSLKTWSFDIGLNATNPQTDIRYNDFFGTTTPKNEYNYGAQLRITKMFDNAFGLQGNLSYNRLSGVFDTLVPFREDRQALESAGITEGIWFRNNVVQGSLNIYWNISNTVFNINKYNKSVAEKKPIRKRWFSLYATAGLGFSIFDPHVMRLSDNAPATVQESFPDVEFQVDRSTEVVLPLAIGTKFKLSKSVDLGLEFAYHFLFTDKLDGFNYNHPNRLKFDAYATGGLVLSFKLGGKKTDKEHIEWTNSVEPIFEEIAKINSIKRKVDKLASDTDEDGVSDYFDSDTETPEGVAVGADGKALDTDKDGVPDYKDEELFTDNGAEVDEQGKALDTDKDGVPDHLDLEDGTSKGVFVNFQGRSIDDNITVKKDETGLRNLALPSIFFDVDKSNIKREFEDELFLMALTIKRNVGLRFVLEGHCDETGTPEYNKELGKRRSEAVKNYLIENYKLDPSLFTIVSKGNEEAVSPRFSVNRRVDIIVAE